MSCPVEKTEEQKKAEKRARRLARKEKAIRERIATAERTLANLPDRLDRVKPTAKPQVKEEVRGKLVLLRDILHRLKFQVFHKILRWLCGELEQLYGQQLIGRFHQSVTETLSNSGEKWYAQLKK